MRKGEGVRECTAWLGGLGVCSLVSKRYVHEFFPMHSFPGGFFCGFYSVGFSPWVFGSGPRTGSG